MLQLKNNQQRLQHYRILALCHLDKEGHRINSTRHVVVRRAQKTIASIPLPITDEEVKNFSLVKIAETNSGFEIAVNWGRGSNIYDVDFYFTFRNSQIFLDRVSTYNYGPGREGKTTTTKVDPLVPIDKFKMTSYLQ